MKFAFRLLKSNPDRSGGYSSVGLELIRMLSFRRGVSACGFEPRRSRQSAETADFRDPTLHRGGQTITS
jgi:hypothetical protein